MATKQTAPEKPKTILNLPYGTFIKTSKRIALYIGDTVCHGVAAPVVIGPEIPNYSAAWTKLNVRYYNEETTKGLDFGMFPVEIGFVRFLINAEEESKGIADLVAVESFISDPAWKAALIKVYGKIPEIKKTLIFNPKTKYLELRINEILQTTFPVFSHEPELYVNYKTLGMCIAKKPGRSPVEEKGSGDAFSFYEVNTPAEHLIIAVNRNGSTLDVEDFDIPFDDFMSNVQDYFNKYGAVYENGKIKAKYTCGLTSSMVNLERQGIKIALKMRDLRGSCSPQEIPKFSLLPPEMLAGMRGTQNGLLWKEEKGFAVKIQSFPFGSKVMTCEVCEKLETIAECKVFDGHRVCRPCFESFTFNCILCHRPNQEIRLRYVNTFGSPAHRVCRSCVGNLRECSECSQEKVWHAHGSTCRAYEAKIHEYNWQPPKIIKFGKARTLDFHIGLELELDTPVPLEVTKAVVERWPGKFYFKRDGSVRGVECVSMPLTRAEFLKIDISQLNRPELQITAEDKGGIHLHIDRSAFTSPQIGNMLDLMYMDKSKVYAVAERPNNSYTQPFDRRAAFGSADLKKLIGGDKYYWVNFRHNHTLEFRIFNSTIKQLNFQKNFDYVSALWKHTKDGGLTDLSWVEFRRFVTKEKRIFKFLDQFLTTKGL